MTDRGDEGRSLPSNVAGSMNSIITARALSPVSSASETGTAIREHSEAPTTNVTENVSSRLRRFQSRGTGAGPASGPLPRYFHSTAGRHPACTKNGALPAASPTLPSACGYPCASEPWMHFHIHAFHAQNGQAERKVMGIVFMRLQEGR